MSGGGRRWTKPPWSRPFARGGLPGQRSTCLSRNRCRQIHRSGALENLLITPHTAGLTEKLWHRHYELFSDNLRRYLARQPLRFVVDKQKGY